MSYLMKSWWSYTSMGSKEGQDDNNRNNKQIVEGDGDVKSDSSFNVLDTIPVRRSRCTHGFESFRCFSAQI